MRKLIRRYLPNHAAIHGNRWLAPFADTLLHPALWHLNRRSAAGAFAAGLFCGLIPGPFQMLGAAIAALIFRVNLPLAMATTLYTNPLTIIPLYVLANTLGQWALGSNDVFIAPPDYGTAGLLVWMRALSEWMTLLGKPLIVGLLLLASLLALAGYGAVRLAWRLHSLRTWHVRPGKRQARK